MEFDINFDAFNFTLDVDPSELAYYVNDALDYIKHDIDRTEPVPKNIRKAVLDQALNDFIQNECESEDIQTLSATIRLFPGNISSSSVLNDESEDAIWKAWEEEYMESPENQLV